MSDEKEKTLLDVLGEIKVAIEKATFAKIPPPPGCQAYDATSDDWRILVVSFGSKKQRGYDGTATGKIPLRPEEAVMRNPPSARPLIVRLTPELAKLAGERAEKQVLS